MSHKDYLDEIIKYTLKQSIERHGDTPDPKKMWEKIEKEILLREYTKKNSKKKITRFSVAAALILFVGVGFLIFPGSVRAVGQKILKHFDSVLVGDSIITQGELVHDEKVNSSVPPPDSQSISVDELLKTAPFHISLPGYLPGGYVLESVLWNATDNYSGEAVLQYAKNESILLVRQRNIIDDYASGVGVDVDDTAISKIKLQNGITASIAFRKKDGWCKIWWINPDISYQISGKLEPEEIIRISNNLK